jgi:DNA-directed RNA polymerase specialized sigma24 family protein
MSDDTDVSPATQAPLVPAKCLLTAQQAAERLQVPLGTVRAWLRHGWPMPKP